MDEELQKAVQPFKEKTELVDGFIEEIREKLGEEEVTKINDTLLGLQNTVNEAINVHVESTETLLKTTKRNHDLVEANNDLYIKNSKTLKGMKSGTNSETPPDGDQNIDPDSALDKFAELATKK